MSTLNDCSVAKRRNSSLVSWMFNWYVGSRWPVHSCRYVLCLWARHELTRECYVKASAWVIVCARICTQSRPYLAKHVAKADSGTCGPQTGSSPLHLVLAFWRRALSHSSRPRASLSVGGKKKVRKNENWPDSKTSERFLKIILNISRYWMLFVTTWQLPDGSRSGLC